MADHSTASVEPLLTRVNIGQVIAWLAALLVFVGAGHASTWLGGHAEQISAVIVFVAPYVSALLARRHVTPVAAPRDVDGNDLVPAGSAAATLDAAVALARADEIHPAE